MQFCVFEDDGIDHLEPLTATRAVYDLRVAHHTLLDRLCNAFNVSRPILHVREDLEDVTAEKYARSAVNEYSTPREDALFVNGRFLAVDEDLVARIRDAARSKQQGTVFLKNDTVVAAWVPDSHSVPLSADRLNQTTFRNLREQSADTARLVSRLWHFIEILPEMLARDGRRFLDHYGSRIQASTLQETGVIVQNPERIHCASTAAIKPGALLNAEDGPIVIDEQAVVMERAVLRGPLYLGPHSQIKSGGRIDTSAFGPYTNIGGEVEHSIVHSYANKVHDGFMGSSYIGQWCNLAADTNTSTLRNDYSSISLYNHGTDTFEQTDRQFLGLFMGDHSKCGINTMFNPGTVAGVFCNIFGSGYMPRYIPSFSWGSPGQFSPYRVEKALKVAEAAMAHRDVSLSNAQRELLRQIQRQKRGQAASREQEE